ncbi:FUSC family protein [Thalassobellus citreus]|uniref:FUSC family protein n=1 Tax=Thalassobellus citreus TaxID=3367752 RepID=UPI0037987C85
MEKLNKKEEYFFKEIMSKSKLEMPFSDFENITMHKIEGKEHKVNTYRETKNSLIGFVAGTVFGIVISFLLLYIKEPIFGYNPQIVALIFQITFTTVLFTQLNTFLKIFSTLN